MKKNKMITALIVLALIVSLFPAMSAATEVPLEHLIVDQGIKPSEGGALQVTEIDGVMTLVDHNGNPIQLRGMSTHGLQWFGEIVNDNAFAALAYDWGSNVIRLAMYVGEDGYATNSEVKDLVYEGIELAFEHDMYVIVDWHVHAPGDPRADVYSGAYEFFQELSDHYKDHPKFHYIIWELANEPSPNNNGGPGIPNNEEGWKAVKEYAEPIVEMLRERGDNIIIVGSPNWSQRPDLAADDPIDSHNVVYTVHFYTGTHEPASESYPEGTPSSERGNVMANARYALENGVAVMATEWGTSEASGDNGPYLAEADVWLNFLNENNISWMNWSLTNKNETSGSFIPFELGVSDATELDPGEDQIWSISELSLSGEYVRTRILGDTYDPIDRTREDYVEVAWDFNDSTTQGFALNPDNPVEDAEVVADNSALHMTGLETSNGVEGDDIWSNARISSDAFSPNTDITGAESINIDVIVTEPGTVAIAAIPQSSGADVWWANPLNAAVQPEDFEEQEDGSFKAVLTITSEQSPALAQIAESTSGNNLSNIVLFVGTDGLDEIWLDNITFSGNRAIPLAPPAEHDELGEAAFPSDFEDGTRQGWDWSGESGVKTSLTIEEVNGTQALSWEYAYPEVKPSDGWASAPRLDFWKEDLARGNNEVLAFDLYIDPVSASEGAISINLAFQPPTLGFWAQAPSTYSIDLSEMDAESDTIYHYEVTLDVRGVENLEDDTQLRNMLVIFADDESDFAGRVYMDNVRFDSDSGSGNVTRAEFAGLIAAALELEAEATSAFADIADNPHADAIHAVAEAGIVLGRSNESFDPTSSITREEMAIMIVRALSFLGSDADASGEANIADQDAISSWAQSAVQTAVQLELMSVDENGQFHPLGYSSVDEAEAVLAKLLSN